MSRIGKLPIAIAGGVTVTINDENIVTVKGPLGELTQTVDKDITVKVEGDNVIVTRPTEQKRHRAMHGLYRSLINSMVEGVSKGFEKKLELVGIGYRVEAKGDILDFMLGYSHHIHFQIPKEVKAEVKAEKKANPVVILKSADKQLIGQVAAKIRSLRPPEPYKGKGIHLDGEQIRRKAGKAASK